MANHAPGSFGTAFATAGFSFDSNLSPNNQAFGNAVLAVVNRNPVAQGTSFVNLVVTGTATIATLQVTTATIATENVSTATISQLVAGTATVSLLSVSGVATFASLNVTGTATIGGPLTASGTATFASINVTGTATIGGPLTASGTATFVSLNVTGTATIAGPLTANGTTTLQGVVAFGPVFGGLVTMQPDSGSFTGTLTGVTPVPTCTVNWRKMGNLVILTIAGTQGTSNANTLTITGLPAAIQPATTQNCPCTLIDNGGNRAAVAQVAASGTITFLLHATTGTSIAVGGSFFTASGQKGPNVTNIGPYILA